MTTPLQLAQFRGQLDALGLTTRQRRRRLTESEVPQPEVIEDGDLGADGFLPGEELGAFLDGHVEDISDGTVVPHHLQRVGIVALAFTGGAQHLDIGHEVHLGADRALTLALLAAPALHVEAEAAWFVTA